MAEDTTEQRPTPPAPKPKRRRRKRKLSPEQLAKAVVEASPAGRAAAAAAAAQTAERADIFAGLDRELQAIDWNDSIAREAALHAMISRVMAKVITVPKLTDGERERLQWVVSLSKQLKEHRDAAQIEAALRKLRGEDELKHATVSGPSLEATVVEEPASSEYQGEEGGERSTRQAIRGRPRTRAFA